MNTVWLLWDQRDDAPYLIGVYAIAEAAHAAWDETVRAEAELEIAQGGALDGIRTRLDRTIAAGIDGVRYSLEERAIEG